MELRTLGSLLLALSLPPAASSAAPGPAWQRIPVFDTEPVSCLYARGDSLWIGVKEGVRVSADAGATWSAARGVGNAGVTSIAGSRGTLAACRGRSLYLSLDGGLSWSLRDSLPQGTCGGMGERDDTLFAWDLPESPDAYALRFSADGGLTWRDGGSGIPPAPPRVAFRGGVYGFEGTALFRLDGTGADTLADFEAGIQALAASGGRFLMVRSDRLFASSVPESGWTLLGTKPAEIREVAACGRQIAVATGQGIRYSADGTVWKLLAENSGSWYPLYQQLALGENRLFFLNSHLYTDRKIRIYFPDRGTWATDSLPFKSFNGPAFYAFAASGSRTAFTGLGTPTLLAISDDEGDHYQEAGPLPSGQYSGGAVPRLGFAGHRLVFFRDKYTWLSEDDGRSWAPVAGCGYLYDQFRFALNDFGFYISRNDSILRMPLGALSCGNQPIPLPEGVKPGGRLNIAGAGDALYLGTAEGLWVLKEDSPQAIRRGTRRSFAHRSALRSPVRVWASPVPPRSGAPGNGNWVDAKGAVRR